MPDQPTPQWQPIAKLPSLAQHIDGWRAAVEEQYDTLQPARDRPYSLDDYTVGRVIQVFTTQRDDLWLFDEQVRRWRSGPLTPAQQREVERLMRQMRFIRQTITAVLALADDLKEETIEKLLAKSDLEVGIETLQRWGQMGNPDGSKRDKQP